MFARFRLFVFFLLFPAVAIAQHPPRSLLTNSFQDSQTFQFRGSVHPLAKAANDRGPLPDSAPFAHMLLLLNRPPERESDLRDFLFAVHQPGSPSFHHWLTPEEFGTRFGPSEADIQEVANWLNTQGLSVEKISRNRQFLSFSGTAGQLRNAFRTEIHQYSVAGRLHYANSSDISIPAALAPVIRGISPLNNFRAHPNYLPAGSIGYQRSTQNARPHWTIPNPDTKIFAVGPEDFATQYDLQPLYQGEWNGKGQTIAIINESNVDLSVVSAHHQLFSLPSPLPNVVVDGFDPGIIPSVDTEAYLDLEMAGSIATGSNVSLYISGGDLLTDPLYLAALRAVEDNQAGVLSVSFGNCEGFLQQAGNAQWASLWEQAAAQGQSVFVSSGDSGSAGCDDGNSQYRVAFGLAVNGIASTPWNIAVGGTDFFYSDYATGGASASTLWNQTNDANLGSLKSSLPEQVWGTAYGLNTTGPFVLSPLQSIPAAGGGASSCVNSTASTNPNSPLPFVCNSGAGGRLGYPKPSWQSAAGVPADGVRDIPDVSLFAANGTNWSAYPICASPGDCITDNSGQGTLSLVGGTSASTPAMAAFMAIINQKYGRQGQANFVLYPLFQQKPSLFHDVTRGSNNVPCVSGTPNCSLDSGSSDSYSLQKYLAAVGYDLASGLGSFDFSAVFNNWNSISFASTTTSLSVSPSSAKFGSPVTISVDVKSSTGGTPQGAVTILTNSLAPDSVSQTVLTLSANGTASLAVNDLPGGTYEIWAQYSGDGVHASSKSATQTITISQASGALTISAYGIGHEFFDPAVACHAILPPFSRVTPGAPALPNGVELLQNEDVVVDAAAAPGATGTVVYSVDNQSSAAMALDASSHASFVLPRSLTAGAHTVFASYAGDTSYLPSTSASFPFVIDPAGSQLSAFIAANCTYSNVPIGDPVVTTCTFSAGGDLTVEVRLQANSCLSPTGKVTVHLGALAQDVAISPAGLGRVGAVVRIGEATFRNIPAGTYPLSATYAGDANFSSATTVGTLYGDTTVVVSASPAAALVSSTAVVANPSSMTYQGPLNGSFVVYTVNVTGPSGSSIAPTGTVALFVGGQSFGILALSSTGTNTASAVSGPEPIAIFDFGKNDTKAFYSGDANYKPSVSPILDFEYVVPKTPGFFFSTQVPEIAIAQGASGTVGLNLTSSGGFNGPVSLSCATSSSLVSCSVDPNSATLAGAATAKLTIHSMSQAAVFREFPFAEFSGLAAILLLSFVIFSLWHRVQNDSEKPNLVARSIFVTALFLAGCGSSGGGSPPPPPPPPPPHTQATYDVVVTAAANGVVHNVKVTVIVH